MNKWIMLFAILWSTQAVASFSETSKRYLSPKDMFTLLAQKFPVLNDPAKTKGLEKSCWILGVNNVNVTGLVNPAIGLPANTQPGAGFVRWWGSCAERIVGVQFKELTDKASDEKLWKRYWEISLLDRFRDKNTPDKPFHQMSTVKWIALSEKMRENQVRFLIEEWIGPNAVVKDLGFSKGTDELIGLLNSTLGPAPAVNVEEANKKLLLALILREEFVSY